MFKKLFCLIFLIAGVAAAQTKIMIPAGTPEDQALQAISNEADTQKKIAMLEEFVQKYAGNKEAVAFGNWQLAQQYSVTDAAKSLQYGDRALAAMPDVMEILTSQADTAQQLKAYDKVVDYASRGAVVYGNIAKQAKPEGVSDQDFATRIADEKKAMQQSYDYLEVAGYNAIATEPDPKKRMAEIEQYMPAFPASKFTQQVAAQAIVTLQEMKDTAALAAFGDKVLGKDPKDVRLLTVLANAYISDPSGAYLAKAGTYARKAIELEKTETGEDIKSFAGVAHSVLGQVLLRENKFLPASTELKTAAALLKGSGQDEAGAWYYLGFAYAKMEKAALAIEALNNAVAIDSPYKQPAQDLLGRIKAARTRK
jgi:tetratricopeptide (TPR) repeat protein